MNDSIKKMNDDTNCMELTRTERKVLSFLSRTAERNLFGNEVARRVGASRGAANVALRSLVGAGLLTREKIGRDYFYRADASNPILRQFKVSLTLSELAPFVKALEPISERVILFGSAGEGTDFEESDVDLFVVSARKAEASDLRRKFKAPREIRMKVVSPSEYLSLKSAEPAFVSNVSKGLVLWRAKHD